MSEKSDAQETIESAIRSGLAMNAHVTRLTADKSDVIVADIMSELFDPFVIWALQEYLAQQNMHSDASPTESAKPETSTGEAPVM